MQEFEMIAEIFAPLAKGYSGSFNLTDDAAVIATPPGCELVVTKDAICAGIHYLGDEDAAMIAQKLLRVNLSDLAAMGASPLAYLLAMQLPKDTDPEWVKRFAEGLEQDQLQFGIHLAGGDTTSCLGAAGFSITAFGAVPHGRALRRNGAKPGDIIYATGTLGDSAFGLELLQQNITNPLPQSDETYLQGRYFLPQPRVSFGQGLVGIASSAMDISDGLVQDLGHICQASGVGGTILRERLPVSDAAQRLIDNDASYWVHVLAGGDDYELLFTAPPDQVQNIKALQDATGVPAAAIGQITDEHFVRVEDESGQIIAVPRKGFMHFE